MIDLSYTFEDMFDGTFQVRLSGEFVGYTLREEPVDADKLIKEYGFDSREEYLKYRLKQYLK